MKSWRYRDPEAAEKAALSLPRLEKKFCSIRVEPLSRKRGNFDVLILFLKSEKAMRVVQARAYTEGKRAATETIGAASICGNCTALAIRQGLGYLSGARGRRSTAGMKISSFPSGLHLKKLKKFKRGFQGCRIHGPERTPHLKQAFC